MGKRTKPIQSTSMQSNCDSSTANASSAPEKPQRARYCPPVARAPPVANEPITHVIVCSRTNNRQPRNNRFNVPDTMAVKLSIPDPDEECSLTLEPIMTSRLTFLPGCTFFENKPEICKMTLPCGHGFSAMNLIYHMCKNNMLCPCCRAGFNVPASLDSIPSHFRGKFQEHIGSTRAEEEADEERALLQEIRALEPTGTTFRQLADTNRLTMTVSFVNPATIDPHRGESMTTIIVGLNLHAHDEPVYNRSGVQVGVRTVYRPRPSQLSLLGHIRDVSPAVRVAAVMEPQNMEPIVIERTLDIPIPNVPSANSNVLDVQPGQLPSISVSDPRIISSFETEFSRDGDGVYLSNLGWIPHIVRFFWAVAMD